VRRLFPYLVLFLLIAPIGTVVCGQDATALIGEADQAYDRKGGSFDFNLYETDLRQAITLWEEALPLIPDDQVQTKAHVLNCLAQGCFELATGYLATVEEKETSYGKGKDYALESLRLDPDFVATEDVDGFRAALRAARDVEAIFWYGNDLGRYLNYHPLTAITGGMTDVLASFERSIELDRNYDGGGPERALAAFLAQVPSILGGDLEQARVHFESALEIDPDYLENYVNYAEYYAKQKKDWDLFESLLSTALDKGKDPGVMATWPFYNTLSLERAKGLWIWWEERET
jgi:tetratricopeptide (TPR) repeat protein